MKGSSLTNQLPSPSPFFGLGVMNNAAKPDCILPIGDDGSSNRHCFSGKLVVIKINEAQLSWKEQLCQNANTGNHDFLNIVSKKNSNRVSLFNRNYSLDKVCFL
jgi:hypothetical protein